MNEVDTVFQATSTSKEVKKRLTAKDFVFIAIFSVIIFIVFLAFSMVFSLSANLAWWTHTVASIPAGIVWIYLMVKIPKRGVIFITGAIMAIIGFLLGMFWTGPLGIIMGALIAELIVGTGKRSALKLSIGFAASIFCFWIGQLSYIWIVGQAYAQLVVDMGLTAEYGQGLVDWANSPVCILAGVGTCVGSLLGGLLGIKVFKKHFEKITV